MLYKYNGKIYLKVSGKFVEVNIKKDKKNEYTVTPEKSKRIEAYGNESKFIEISIDKAYEMLNKSSNYDLKLKEDELENK